MPSNHLIRCHCLLLPSSMFPSIRVFSNESALHIRWPKYWSFSISPSSEYSGLISFQFSPVAQSCPTLRDPMNRSTPGLPVHHQLLEFTQTPVHRVDDAIQPSHPLSSPSFKHCISCIQQVLMSYLHYKSVQNIFQFPLWFLRLMGYFEIYALIFKHLGIWKQISFSYWVCVKVHTVHTLCLCQSIYSVLFQYISMRSNWLITFRSPNSLLIYLLVLSVTETYCNKSENSQFHLWICIFLLVVLSTFALYILKLCYLVNRNLGLFPFSVSLTLLTSWNVLCSLW